jgi:hypothetical protein
MPRQLNDEVLPQELILKLSTAFQRMSDQGFAVASAIKSDYLAGYPVYVPTHGDSEAEHTSREALQAAIRSMTHLTIRPDTRPQLHAGIICCSPATVLAVSDYNDAKGAFKQAVLDIRQFQKNRELPASRITRLIQNEIRDKGFRSETLRRAMDAVRIADLDLKRCYARIRIMPPNLQVFSWSWTTKHSRIIKLTHEEALRIASEWPDQHTSAIAVDLIHRRCNPDTPLARKVPLPNQLRANYAFLENGEVVRASTPISGVVVAQQKVLPRKLWRSDPGSADNRSPRLPRQSSLEATPIVDALSLYRYVR